MRRKTWAWRVSGASLRFASTHLYARPFADQLARIHDHAIAFRQTVRHFGGKASHATDSHHSLARPASIDLVCSPRVAVAEKRAGRDDEHIGSQPDDDR